MADSLLSEVDADVRAEKLAALWRQWRQPVAVFCVVLVLATAASQLWQHHRETRGGEWLTALARGQELLSKGKAADAATAFAGVAKTASGEARDIAQLWQGRALVAAAKPTEAMAVLKEVSTHGPNLWSDMACLRLAALDAKQAALCLSAKTDSPLALERAQWHAAQAFSEGDSAAAVATLESIAAKTDAPPSTRAMAQQWLATIQAKP